MHETSSERRTRPVPGALLRAYNDALDDERRQDLYVYAAKVVGSRGSGAVERARADRLTAWASGLQRRRFARSLVPEHLRRLAPRTPIHVTAAGAVHAVLAQHGRSRDEVSAFVDELLAIGTPSATPSMPPHWTVTADKRAEARTTGAR